MAKKSGKSGSSKYDLLITMKTTAMEIDNIGSNGVDFETHNKGKVAGRLYSGVQHDTVTGRMFPDGSGEFTVKFVQMTTKGETVVGQGTGKQEAPNKQGKASFKGQVTTWTGSKRLSNVNGATWDFEGVRTMSTEIAEIRVTLSQGGGSHMQQHTHDHEHEHSLGDSHSHESM